ncbi:FUSC family protein [Zavarzinia compransoris]|uniref:FUSC family protein n=1 Tax=Zavarzinia marina TaxID=2911065 RepID=UPI001F2E22CC|nr:FUSC family protein [Zavarzinia marina]MCF4165652.1 FUSC family protein [Zavarzinia marina]
MVGPRPRDLLFSVKTFAAGMLAIYIAFRLDLGQPGWALLTAYIVSQPLSGAVLAKSLARFAGTFVGATVAVALVAAFSGAREVFIPAIALWVGACLYVSILLREASSSYGAMLAGYTAVIVGFGSVAAPLSAFDVAVARCTEISLGIACATVVSRLVLPRTTGGLLRRTLAECLAAARAWGCDVLRGRSDDARRLPDRRRLLGDVMMLDQLRVNARLDTPAVRAGDAALRRIQATLLTLMSMLVSVQDRLRLLRRDRPERLAALEPLMDDLAERIEGGRMAEDADLHARIAAALPDLDAMRADPARRIEHIMVARLGDILRLDRELRRRLAALRRGEPDTGSEGPGPALNPYRDHTQALVGGLVAALSIGLTALFWIATGWPEGGSAVVLVAVVCSIMASQDSPARGAVLFLLASVAALGLAGLYNFAVFPAIAGFPLFVLAFGLVLVPLGALIPVGRLGMLVLPTVMTTIAISGLGNDSRLGFEGFVNGGLALIVGVGFAVGCLRLLRPFGVEWAVRRHLRGVRLALSRLAAERAPEARTAFESRMFDHINALISRLGAEDTAHREILLGALASLRIGLNILLLRRELPHLPPPLGDAATAGLDALARHFAGRGGDPVAVLDTVADRVAGIEGADGAVTTILVALSGIRTSLAEHTGFFRLEPAPPARAMTEAVPC